MLDTRAYRINTQKVVGSKRR